MVDNICNAPKYLDKKEYCKISIYGDGNCFYSYLSINLEKYKGKYSFYSNIIYEYITNNKEN